MANLLEDYMEGLIMNHTTEQARAILERHDEIQIALVFGSMAEGHARPDSDLDIGVAARKPLSALEQLDLIDELAATFGRPIDLIDLLTAAAPILRQVLTKGVFILKKDTDLYARLLRKLWYDQADIMPNYNMILRHRREKFIKDSPVP